MKVFQRSGCWLIICSLICTVSAQIEAGKMFGENELSQQSIAELKLKAEELGNQWSGSSIHRSIDLYLKMSESLKSSGEIEKAADFLRQTGRLFLLLGDYQNASVQFEKALQSDTASKNLAGKAETLSLLSLVSLQTMRIEESESYLNEALKLSWTVENPTSKAAAFSSAAELRYSQRRLDEAIIFCQLAISFWQKAGNISKEAEMLRLLSFAYIGNNDLSASMEKVKEALEKSRTIEDKRGEALAQYQIGFYLIILNEPQKALEICQNAETLFPDDMDFIEKARLSNGIGMIYENYGDWKSALQYKQKALELFKEGNYPNGQLATLPTLVKLNFLIGNQSSAFEYFKQTQELSAKLNDIFYLANAISYVGDFYSENNLTEKAIEHYQLSLKYLAKLKYLNGISSIQNNLGRVYLRQNQLSPARKHFDASLRTSRAIANKFAEAETLSNLAKVNLLEANDSEALKLSELSIEITNSLSSIVPNSKLRSAYFSNVFDRYELYINLLMKRHRQSPNADYAIQALRAAEKSRARSMLENLSLAEADFIKDASPETVKREKEIRVLLNSKADKLTDLLSQNSDQAETAKLDGEINELEHELERIKATLKQNSPIYSAIKNPAPFDVADFQRDILDENSLLLEFSFGKEESYLWLVGKTEVDSYVLPPREQLESRIEKLRKLIDSRGMLEGETVENYQARIAAAETEFEREAQIFSRELLGQVAGKLADKRLIIVPDGKLHYFPIAALPFPNSIDNLPILLTNETIYEPSAATLALLMRKGQKISALPKNLLVFSDPIFSNQDARIAMAAGSKNETQSETGLLKAEKFRFAESLTSLARLNASQDEADAIVEIIGESESTALGGAAATRERALDASIADYKVIHFATHGLINEERPELSGIVLSQVDETGQTSNGVVRLQDIYAMNLSADAVVLSACNTGIGKEVKGEGLLSLSNAFLQVGAKSVVSSLWKVDDYAARELMKNFYRELTSGTVTTAEALRRAQIKMRQNPQYKSPFYWAAFTVQGDFQIVPQLAAGFDYRIYGLLVLPFALIAFYIYRRRFKLFNRKIINKG